MTNEEAKKMLEAKLKCLIAETSGTNYDCNMQLCDGCALNYEQGNMGEQKEALDLAIRALEQTSWIPVSERLPEESGRYLVTYERYSQFYTDVAMFDINQKGNHGFFPIHYIIAWTYLPQPYKAESEDKE